MIFDETQYYDKYEKSKLIKKLEKSDFVKFWARNFRFAFEPIDTDEKNWLNLSIRQQFVSESVFLSALDEGISINTIEKNVIKSAPSTLKQLKTFDETLFMTFNPSIEKFTKDKKQKFSLSISQYELLNDFQSISNSNVATKRKNKKKITLDQFSKTEHTPLDMTEIRKKSIEVSTDLNTINIIEKKRARRFNIKFANTAWIFIEKEKSKISINHAIFFAFHVAFMIEINRIAAKKESRKFIWIIYQNRLLI